MMKNLRFMALFLALSILVSWGTGVPGGDNASDGGSAGGSLSSVNISKISSDDYNALSSEEKYRVANKLMATLFKGIAVKDFFNIQAGMDNLTLANGVDFIANIDTALTQVLVDKDIHLSRIDNKYEFDSAMRPQQYPMAMLFELPVSKDFFDYWMAYKLANTILFSPAVELDSVYYTDIQRVFYRLSSMVGEDRTIRDIVYEHMVSQENWRRFRSPEDNTREMVEIFLARFIDEEVPKAAAACKNWYLTDDSQDYQLMIDYDSNTEPQYVLDTVVISCYDFYRAVSEHADLIPRITSILVNTFFATYPDDKKAQMVSEIVGANPNTFRQLFSTIILSKEYLLNNERPKAYEETFFNLAGRIDWYAPRRFFQHLNRPSSYYSSIETLHEMKQASMTYKLGRPGAVPLDSLSFSYYHKSVRERSLIDRKTNPFSSSDGGWQADFIDVDLEGSEFIHYLFLSAISRRATGNELSTLNQIIESMGHGGDKMKQAMIVLDYCSRLAELYAFRAIT